MDNLTVIYYTSNREQEGFEDNIRKTLLKTIGDLPLISVSQKPIDFGRNICVGDIGATPENMLLQVMSGAVEAKTKFVGMAESDCLYHKSYFEFRPDSEDTFYYPDECYLLWVGNRNRKYWRYHRREISSIVGREHLIKIIGKILLQSPKHIRNIVPKLTKQETFHPDYPVISIKTRDGMHWASAYSREYETELPFWGRPKELLKEYGIR